MLIMRKSQVSGVVRTLDLPITGAQLEDYEMGALIQNAFPNCSADEREFFLTGITKEEWDALWKEPEEDLEDDERAF